MVARISITPRLNSPTVDDKLLRMKYMNSMFKNRGCLSYLPGQFGGVHHAGL